MASTTPITILIAEDDQDDREFLSDALGESPPAKSLRFVEDGEQLMDYLGRRGSYGQPHDSPRPGLVILDLKMPRKSGWEALEEIKADPELRTSRSSSYQTRTRSWTSPGVTTWERARTSRSRRRPRTGWVR